MIVRVAVAIVIVIIGSVPLFTFISLQKLEGFLLWGIFCGMVPALIVLSELRSLIVASTTGIVATLISCLVMYLLISQDLGKLASLTATSTALGLGLGVATQVGSRLNFRQAGIIAMGGSIGIGLYNGVPYGIAFGLRVILLTFLFF